MPTKTVSLLADRDCARIHDSALRLLQSVGVLVANQEARQLLGKGGARVDESGVVRLPPQLVQEALRAAPKEIELAGEGYRFRLPSEYTHYASRVKYPRQQTYPPSTDHVPTRQDIVNNCRLANALPLTKAVFVLDGPTADFDEADNWLLTPATVLSHTPKHVISPSIHLRSARCWVETAEAASDSGDLTREPRLTIMVSPHGPLRLDSDTADVLLFAVRRGIPVSILPIPMAGVTAPLTLAGTLAVGAAEALFMITLAQAIRAGEYLSHPHTLRWLRTGERYFGGTFDRASGMDESKAMLQAAHRKVEEILERRPAGEVSPAARERVRSYVREQKGPAVSWL